jgi:arginine/lysine/ornithine decarboxylase
MKPSDAYAHIAHRKTQRVPIDDLEGRITTSLVTPYPPGIPLLIPGEVFNKKIVDYLKFSREFNLLCPGFETDIHGLVEVEDDHGNVSYFADCVAEGKPMPESQKVGDELVQVGSDGPYGRTI